MTAQRIPSKLLIVAFFLAFVLAVSARVSLTQLKYQGLPQDWSHRHLLFTATDTIQRQLISWGDSQKKFLTLRLPDFGAHYRVRRKLPDLVSRVIVCGRKNLEQAIAQVQCPR